jgi:hypothetical protein
MRSSKTHQYNNSLYPLPTDTDNITTEEKHQKFMHFVVFFQELVSKNSAKMSELVLLKLQMSIAFIFLYMNFWIAIICPFFIEQT